MPTESDYGTSVSNNFNLTDSATTTVAATEGGAYDTFMLPLWCKVIAFLVFSTITVLAVTGNAAVIYVVLRFKRMRRSPTNLLIMNLAVGDLMIGIMNTTTTYWPTIMIADQEWPFGEILCVLIHYEQMVVVLVSSYTLVAISADRFVAILFPLNPQLKLTRHRSLCAISVIWTASCLISFPVLFVQKLIPPSPDASPVCMEYPSHWRIGPITASGFTVALLILQYVVPLVVLVVTYAGIGIRLWYSKVPNTGGENQKMLTDRRESVKKMVPMMVLVSFLYAMCWLPLNMLLVANMWLHVNEFYYILVIWWFCFTLAMSHSFVNPIIYCIRNDKFREGFAYLFRWLPCVKYQARYLSDRPTATRSMAYSLVNSIALVPAVSSSGAHSDITSNMHRKMTVKDEDTTAPVIPEVENDEEEETQLIGNGKRTQTTNGNCDVSKSAVSDGVVVARRYGAVTPDVCL